MSVIIHLGKKPVQSIPVGSIEDTSQGVIPRQEGRQETEKATRLDDRRIWNACSATLKVADSEKQECQVEREEEQEKGNGGAEGGNQEKSGKDPPTLEKGLEVSGEVDGILQLTIRK